jgi:hypothetical protein
MSPLLNTSTSGPELAAGAAGLLCAALADIAQSTALDKTMGRLQRSKSRRVRTGKLLIAIIASLDDATNHRAFAAYLTSIFYSWMRPADQSVAAVQPFTQLGFSGAIDAGLLRATRLRRLT